jgi:hypothetical protein
MEVEVFPKWRQVSGNAGRESGLDRDAPSVEDKDTTQMRALKLAAAMVLGLALLAPLRLFAQVQTAPSNKTSLDQTAKITIEVSGGDKSTPVENASVYIKYVEERKIKSNKTVELNVKTNREGTAHVPDAPLGRALVQVVADGWKTYGRWYDVTDVRQTIKIHLDRPPKWY